VFRVKLISILQGDQFFYQLQIAKGV